MKKFLKWLAGIVLVLLLIVISLVGPIDRSPLQEKTFYQKMMAKLDTLKPSIYPSTQSLKAGWSEVDITPSYSMPMAGYIPRPKFESVHDPLYAKILAIDNGSVVCYFISTDLLLFPPELRNRIVKKLQERRITNYFLYLSSSHTHSGLGGWDDSMLGTTALGEYHDEWIEQTAQSVIHKMEEAYTTRQNASLSYFENDLSEWLENRIAFDQGKVDGKVRGFAVQRQDGSKGIAFTFSAHSTSISKDILQLSGDYPSETISQLKSKGYDFGMFMAGMMGSHRFKYLPEIDYEFVKREASILSEKILTSSFNKAIDSAKVRAVHVPIEFGPSQLRIEKDWKARDWVFRWLAIPLKGELTYVEIGNMIFIGTPCDFSGEIFVRENFDQWLVNSGKHLMITSFNGDYVGYITYDPHYETLSKEEVMAMNWVGPYYGQYFTDMIKKLVSK